MSRDDAPKPNAPKPNAPAPSADAPPKAAIGGLKGLQANPDEMAQQIAFEVNTMRCGEYAAKAINKLTAEKLDALIAEAKAAKADVDDDAWSTLDYLRSRYTAPKAIAYETRPVFE